MTRSTNQKAAADRALRKAVKASQHLAEAARLMREAANDTSTTADGHYDYLHWAHQIDEILSCDNGEAGIGPALQKMASKMASTQINAHEHRRADGTIVRVTVPENEERA